MEFCCGGIHSSKWCTPPLGWKAFTMTQPQAKGTRQRSSGFKIHRLPLFLMHTHNIQIRGMYWLDGFTDTRITVIPLETIPFIPQERPTPAPEFSHIDACAQRPYMPCAQTQTWICTPLDTQTWMHTKPNRLKPDDLSQIWGDFGMRCMLLESSWVLGSLSHGSANRSQHTGEPLPSSLCINRKTMTSAFLVGGLYYLVTFHSKGQFRCTLNRYRYRADKRNLYVCMCVCLWVTAYHSDIVYHCLPLSLYTQLWFSLCVIRIQEYQHIWFLL